MTKGEQNLLTAADLVEAVLNLTEDEETSILFDSKARETMSSSEYTRKLMRCIPSMMRKHPSDMLTLVAIDRGCAKEELAEIDISEAIDAAMKIISDRVFRYFFPTHQSGEASSASVRMNTTEEDK